MSDTHVEVGILEVRVTADYSIFEYLNYNRPIKDTLVNAIAQSMRQWGVYWCCTCCS